MASPAPSNHRHPKKAKPPKAMKHRKAATGAFVIKGKVTKQYVSGVTYHRVITSTKGGAKKAAVARSEELTDAQIDAATARGEERAKNEPRAQSAMFDRASRKIVISFANGAEFKFPPELAQGLGEATDDQLADVRVSGNGFGLHWDSLDADLTVPGVVSGVFGTRRFMAQQAGRSTSPAKVAAARENGAKGGRPRKPAHPG
jgi:hypothetical protein